MRGTMMIIAGGSLQMKSFQSECYDHCKIKIILLIWKVIGTKNQENNRLITYILLQPFKIGIMVCDRCPPWLLHKGNYLPEKVSGSHAICLTQKNPHSPLYCNKAGSRSVQERRKKVWDSAKWLFFFSRDDSHTKDDAALYNLIIRQKRKWSRAKRGHLFSEIRQGRVNK